MKHILRNIIIVSAGIAVFQGLCYAGMKTDRFGVGTGSTPTANDIQAIGRVTTSSFTMTTGGTNGYVLTSDASGKGTWQQSMQTLLSSTNTWTAPQTWVSSSTMGTLAVSTISAITAIIIANNGNYVATSGTGKFGIGTKSPRMTLDVSGAIDSQQTAATGDGTYELDVSTANSCQLASRASGLTIDGFVGGQAGQIITVFNTPTNKSLSFTNKGSPAQGHAIVTGTGGTLTTSREGGFTFCFNGTYWYCVASNP